MLCRVALFELSYDRGIRNMHNLNSVTPMFMSPHEESQRGRVVHIFQIRNNTAELYMIPKPHTTLDECTADCSKSEAEPCMFNLGLLQPSKGLPCIKTTLSSRSTSLISLSKAVE